MSYNLPNGTDITNQVVEILGVFVGKSMNKCVKCQQIPCYIHDLIQITISHQYTYSYSAFNQPTFVLGGGKLHQRGMSPSGPFQN